MKIIEESKKTDLIKLEGDGWTDLVIFEEKYHIEDIKRTVKEALKDPDCHNEDIYLSLETMYKVREIICINNVEKVEY